MKKFLSLVLALITVFVASAGTEKVYVNPIQNSTNLDKRVVERLYNKGMLGFTKARTIDVTAGKTNVRPGTEAAAPYSYIITMNVTNATASDIISDAKEVIALGKSLLGGKSSSSSSNQKKNYHAVIDINVVVEDAITGEQLYNGYLHPSASNEKPEIAYFEATSDFDYDTLDLIDDVFPVSGEVVEAVEINKKGEVKKARVQVGSKQGARKDMVFTINKVANGEKTAIGAGECLQVLNGDESIISISGKKDGDRAVSEALQNFDGTYTIEVVSHSRNNLMRDMFQGLDKTFSKRQRSDYLDPFGRTRKPKVAFLPIKFNESSVSQYRDHLAHGLLEGTANATTLETVNAIYPDVESAQKDGIDGLIEVTIDMAQRSTSQEKDLKGNTYTKHSVKLYYTITCIDVANNKWIELRSRYGVGGDKDSSKADLMAVSDVGDYIAKFAQEVFPVAGTILEPVKINDKKGSLEQALINIGTDMGVKKGMDFDVYEQRKDGGAESRFLLATADVKKEGLTADQAIVSIKGKNGGEKRLLELIQNADGNTEIVLVSKVSYGILGGLNKIIGNE